MSEDYYRYLVAHVMCSIRLHERRPLWGLVASKFGIDSRAAIELCERFGMNPDAVRTHCKAPATEAVCECSRKPGKEERLRAELKEERGGGA